MNPTFQAEVIQYRRPNRHPESIQCELPVEVEPCYRAMLAGGYRLEAEKLITGPVSIRICDPVNEDTVGISITPNGPEVLRGLIKMLKRFPKEKKEIP